ncbi:MAG: helix-turn-helix transcriptional regulator, partial [Thermoanaerobaculia bacterium]
MPRASQILLVGQRIRQLRKSRHLTQADLASRIGIAQSDLSRMENGEYKVGLDTLFRILQVFELSMSTFFEEAAPEGDESSHADGDSALVASTAGGALHKDERDQLVSDWTELSEESRREVREFISFKRMQAESRRPLAAPQWKPEGITSPMTHTSESSDRLSDSAILGASIEPRSDGSLDG